MLAMFTSQLKKKTFNTIKHFNMSRMKTSDCIACVLYPILKVGCICGPFALTIGCPHSKKPNFTARFTRSNLLFVILSVTILPLIASITFTIKNVLETENLNKKILLITDVLFSMLAIVINVTGLLKNNEKLVELNGLSAIIDNRYYYGFHSLIDQSKTKLFHCQSYLVISLLFMGIIDYGTYTILEEINSSILIILLKVSMLVVNIITESTIFFEYLISVLLHRHLFSKCFDKIRSILNQHLKASENLTYSTESPESPNHQLLLEENLKRLKMFHSSLMENYKQLNSFMQPSILFCFLVGIILLVFNCYTVVLLYGNDKIVGGGLIIQLRSYGAILIYLMFLMVNEYMYNVVSSLINSLLLYFFNIVTSRVIFAYTLLLEG